MNKWTEEQAACLAGKPYALANGGPCINTISVLRVLAAMLQSLMLTPGRKLIASESSLIGFEGKTYPFHIKFVGGGMPDHIVPFKTRKEQCDYLRNRINGK